MSLNAIAVPAAREPGPLVTRCRSRTVAKVDSIGLVVRRWIQCSPGKSQKASSTSRSLVIFATALGHFAPPVLGQPGDRGGGQPLPGAEELLQRRPEIGGG
jgi:hypothetical protein